MGVLILRPTQEAAPAQLPIWSYFGFPNYPVGNTLPNEDTYLKARISTDGGDTWNSARVVSDMYNSTIVGVYNRVSNNNATVVLTTSGKQTFIYSTNDSMIWRKSPFSINYFGDFGLAELNGTFFIYTKNGTIYEIYTSVNGFNWTLSSTLAPAQMRFISRDGANLRSFVNTSSYTSSDGINWTLDSSWNSPQSVSVNSHGVVNVPQKLGNVWLVAYKGNTTTILSVTYVVTTFKRSIDNGATWSTVIPHNGDYLEDEFFNSWLLEVNHNEFIYKFDGVVNNNNVQVIITSTDGLTWTESDSLSGELSLTKTLPMSSYSYISGIQDNTNNHHVVQSSFNSAVYLSNDNIMWAEYSIPKMGVYDVRLGLYTKDSPYNTNNPINQNALSTNYFAFTNDYAREIKSSQDGDQFVGNGLISDIRVHSAIYDNGRWMVWGDNSANYTQPFGISYDDGVTWYTDSFTESRTPYPSYIPLSKVGSLIYTALNTTSPPMKILFNNGGSWITDSNIGEACILNDFTITNSAKTVVYGSNDGITWALKTTPYFPGNNYLQRATNPNNITKQTFVNGTSTVYVSLDAGASWTSSTVTFATSSIWVGNAFNTSYNTYVVLANNGDVGLLYANNLFSKTVRIPGATSTWSSLTSGNGIYVAMRMIQSGSPASQCAISNDGWTWTDSNMPSSQYWYRVGFGRLNGLFTGYGFIALVDGSDIYATSLDGITWNQYNLPVTKTWRGIAYGNNTWAILADDGTVLLSQYGVSGTWTQYNVGVAQTWNRIEFNAFQQDNMPHRIVQISNNKPAIVFSQNANMGYAYRDVFDNWHYNFNLTSVGDRFSNRNALYANGSLYLYSGNVVISTTDYTTHTTNTLVGPGYVDFYQTMAYMNNTFFAVGDFGGTKKVMYSTDGITWTACPQPYPGVTFSKFFILPTKILAFDYSSTATAWTNNGTTWNLLPYLGEDISAIASKL